MSFRRPRPLVFVPALALAACLAAGAAPAPDLDQRRERVALGFVERIAAGDVDATLAYILEHFAPSLLERRTTEDWRELAHRLGRHAGLEVAGISIDEPGRLQVAVESPDGMELRFGFEFEPDEPEKVAGFSLEAGRGHGRGPALPPFQPPPGADRARLTAALDAYLGRLGSEELFSGAVLIAVDGEAIYRGARGLASREWGAANKIDTRFDLGSINKSFTRIAIAQLVLAGKVRLDDRIADHLPDYPNAEARSKVTVRHLLDHSSGIADIFNERFFDAAKRLFREPEDFFPVFADQPLAFEPGTNSAYSNGGFMVLGAIIAAASGQPYADYVEERIFAPSGMTASGFFARDEPVPNVAIGYTRMGPEGPTEELRNTLFRLPIRGNSAGSAFATVDDLLAFDNAVREHRLLPPAWTNWYFGGAEPAAATAEGSASRSTASIGIAGGAPGVSSVVESDGTLTVIALSNHDEPGAEALARALRRPLAAALR